MTTALDKARAARQANVEARRAAWQDALLDELREMGHTADSVQTGPYTCSHSPEVRDVLRQAGLSMGSELTPIQLAAARVLANEDAERVSAEAILHPGVGA